MGDSLGLASLLRDFVDVLIPGRRPVALCLGGRRPGRAGDAAARGAAARLAPTSWSAALLACGGPLAPLDADGRGRRWCGSFEAAEPALFKLVRNAAYLAYYEHPAVVRAIQGLGQPYQAMPGTKGYPLPAVRSRARPAAARARRTTSGPRT